MKKIGDYQVFISHGWHDRWLAERMHEQISAVGAVGFIDIFDVEKGDAIAERVLSGIQTSDELVCLITPWSVDRHWIWTEMGMMFGLKRRVTAIVYGVTLDDIRSSGGAAMLTDRNVADINEFSDYVRQLKRRLDRRRKAQS